MVQNSPLQTNTPLSATAIFCDPGWLLRSAELPSFCATHYPLSDRTSTQVSNDEGDDARRRRPPTTENLGPTLPPPQSSVKPMRKRSMTAPLARRSRDPAVRSPVQTPRSESVHAAVAVLLARAVGEAMRVELRCSRGGCVTRGCGWRSRSTRYRRLAICGLFDSRIG